MTRESQTPWKPKTREEAVRISQEGMEYIKTGTYAPAGFKARYLASLQFLAQDAREEAKKKIRTVRYRDGMKITTTIYRNVITVRTEGRGVSVRPGEGK